MFARGSAHMIVLPSIAAVLLAILEFWLIALFFIFMTILMLIFFRDPERQIGRGIVSAADGRVDYIKQNEDWLLISVFMNVHNVHVNRAPMDCKALRVSRRGGGHWPAFLEKSDSNSRANMVFHTGIGEIRVVQISGIFAWRVVPYVRRGNITRKGQRIGIIRFGSRVNVWLPASRVRCTVEVGQNVLAGETTLAEIIPSSDDNDDVPCKTQGMKQEVSD